MRKVPNTKLNNMDLTAILETQNFARRNMGYPNEITGLSTFKRRDGFTFYICTTGSKLFKPGFILTARFKNKRLTLAPITGAATEKDLELLISMIKVKDGVPNFQEVSSDMQACGKVLRTELF
jgi:hypothetical protein